jgi:hypothetical protein
MNKRDLEQGALLLPRAEREALADSLRASLARPEPGLDELERRIEQTFAEAFAGPFEEWGEEQWAALKHRERRFAAGSGEGAPPGFFDARLASLAE